MKNIESWLPTKFVLEDHRLRANRDPKCVAISSRLNADLVASAVQEALEAHAGGRLADLGCGNVPLWGIYQSLATVVTCLDWPNSQHPLQHVDIECDLNGKLPLADSSQDTVVLTDVLEHIEYPAKLLAEISRVLAPGGKLIGTVPFLYRLHEEPHDHHRFTKHALLAMAQRCGLTSISLEHYGCGSDVLFDTLGKLAIDAHWRFGSRLSARCQSLGLWFRSTDFGRRLNASHESSPLGYVFVFSR